MTAGNQRLAQSVSLYPTAARQAFTRRAAVFSDHTMLLDVNDNHYEVSAEPDELLVWVIHEKLGLTRTRFGCGIAMCGACKVLVDGEVVQSCTIKVRDVLGKKITTREVLPETVFAPQQALP